jgi:hypothetical protein
MVTTELLMPVSEASAAETFGDRENVAPQDPADLAGHDHSGVLLRTVLEHHRELGLEAGQIAELSRLYWSTPLPDAAEAVDAIERTLSPEQFRKCVAYFAATVANDHGSALPAPADIGAHVKAAVDERLKDKDVIAVDLAAKAADRLITWTRMFGVFVAVPVAAFLGLLSFMGISKFQDVRDIETRAEKTLETAQQTQNTLEIKSKQVDGQLAKLEQHVADNERSINSLNTTVRTLEEKLKFSAANFLRYFQNLGYIPKTATINISTNVTIPGGLSYYDPDSNTVVIKPELIEDETLLLHEYAHDILYSSLSFDALKGHPKSQYSSKPIEGGLADYFVASFRNEPVIGALAAQHLGRMPGLGLPLNLENTERITSTQLGDKLDYPLISRLQLAWAGAFWELRQKLGQDIADKSLYEAWRTLADQDQGLVAHSFIANVAAQLGSAAGKPAVDVWRDLLTRRGVNKADLPNAG